MIDFIRWVSQIKSILDLHEDSKSPGCAPVPLFLTSPNQTSNIPSASGLPAPVESKPKSPKMILSSSSSGKQSPPKNLDLSTGHSVSSSSHGTNLTTETVRTLSDTDGQQALEKRGASGSQNVVVIVDATKELSLAALEWALTKIVCTGDAITVLCVLHQVINPMGYKQKADVNSFNGTSRKQLDEEISRKLEEFQNAVKHQNFQSRCDQNKIKLEVKIAPGQERKIVAANWATELEATWVILDRQMKKDKKYFREHLTCNIVLMKRIGAVVVRLNEPLSGDRLHKFVEEDCMKYPHDDVGHLSTAESPKMPLDEMLSAYTMINPSDKKRKLPKALSTSSLDYFMKSRSQSTTSDLESELDTSSGGLGRAWDSSDPMSTASEVTSDSDGTSNTSFQSRVDAGIIWALFRNPPASATKVVAGPLSSSSGSDYGIRGDGYHVTRVQSGGDKSFLVRARLQRRPRSRSADLSQAYKLLEFDSGKSSLEGLRATESSKRPIQNFQTIRPSMSKDDYGNNDERRAAVATVSDDSKAETSSTDQAQPREKPTPVIQRMAEPLSVDTTSSTLLYAQEDPMHTRLQTKVFRPTPISVHPMRFKERDQLNELLVLTSSKNPKVHDLSNLLKSQSLANPQHEQLSKLDKVRTGYSPIVASTESAQSFSLISPTNFRRIAESTTSTAGGTRELKTGPPPSLPHFTLNFPPNEGRVRLDMYTGMQSSEYNSLNRENDLASLNLRRMTPKRCAPGAPPLCSVCNHKSPEFGRPPRVFKYSELEAATDNFSSENFLAEGGFGFVYKGQLKEGQSIAVKQLKLASTQGDTEFRSEIEVLSCAQHRNLVTLIGYCDENSRPLLVYEFVCNRSLDWHLSSRNLNVLKWQAREKIAVGAARGLRYLHEECRVGCIVHRDMRPNNILLTHDFLSMVGDFGLARWQPSGDTAVETRVIGTLGYLAPEYAETGHITEKSDVFSFGVVLLELITGRKAIDTSKPREQQCLTEWARPLLEERATHKLLDPRLGNDYDDYEVYCMVHAASLCIRKEPSLRPKMSQVLRILEGDKHSTGASPPPPIGFPRSSSAVTFTPTQLEYTGQGLGRVNSADVLSKSSDVQLISSSFGSSIKPDREPILPHSAPISIGVKSQMAQSDSSRHLHPGFSSSHAANATSKAGTSPKSKLSYSDML